MTACSEYETLLHGLIDGELDAAHALACEKHLSDCQACTAELHTIEQLRRRLHTAPLAYVAPPQLRRNIIDALDAAQHAPSQPSRIKTMISAVRHYAWPAVAVAMTVVFAFTVFSPKTTDTLSTQVVAGHVRSLQANHLVDVETSDRHVVKPWFAGKIDFSPPVIDLQQQGFDLIGGRLDYLQNHAVAALAYRRRAHTINLFVWPATSNAALTSESSNGFNLVHWQAAGMTYWAVSDLNLEELRQFQAALAAQAAR
jgi:anti-sigma factor RsiW